MKLRIPFLHNVRRGLATNSSSSHSLVYGGGGPDVQDLDVTLRQAATTDTEFGWSGPTLTTLGERLMYALTDRIGESWSARWSDKGIDELLAAAKEKYGDLFPEFEGQDALWVNAISGYVDHQSRGTSDDMEAIRTAGSTIEIDNDNH